MQRLYMRIVKFESTPILDGVTLSPFSTDSLAGQPMNPMFSQSQLTAIADALADTSEGLSGSEIAHLLTTCKMPDPSPGITKRHRLYNAFVESQNLRQDRKAILAFVRHSMKPEL